MSIKTLVKILNDDIARYFQVPRDIVLDGRFDHEIDWLHPLESAMNFESDAERVFLNIVPWITN